MATYDNKIWLLKNIRDAFIATDDTGLCEIVMAGEDFSKIFRCKYINYIFLSLKQFLFFCDQDILLLCNYNVTNNHLFDKFRFMIRVLNGGKDCNAVLILIFIYNWLIK